MTTNSKIYTISISKLRPFENHPYKVYDNAEMDELAESVRVNGVITPLVIHPIGNDMYEVISGHRRLHAAQKAGLLSVPAVIYTMTKEEAAIALVDSNLHREHILPSEKAIAYKLKMESIKHQGKTSRQVVGKLESADKINPNESGRQIQR